MAVWPVTLPTAIQFGAAIQAGENVLRTPTVPAKMRRRFTTDILKFSGNVYMTSTQLSTFEAFFESTLAGGTLPFDWQHPLTGATVSMRFTSRYETVRIAVNGFAVSLPLEILP